MGARAQPQLLTTPPRGAPSHGARCHADARRCTWFGHLLAKFLLGAGIPPLPVLLRGQEGPRGRSGLEADAAPPCGHHSRSVSLRRVGSKWRLARHENPTVCVRRRRLWSRPRSLAHLVLAKPPGLEAASAEEVLGRDPRPRRQSPRRRHLSVISPQLLHSEPDIAPRGGGGGGGLQTTTTSGIQTRRGKKARSDPVGGGGEGVRGLERLQGARSPSPCPRAAGMHVPVPSRLRL